jgi:predicted secreted protein
LVFFFFSCPNFFFLKKKSGRVKQQNFDTRGFKRRPHVALFFCKKGLFKLIKNVFTVYKILIVGAKSHPPSIVFVFFFILRLDESSCDCVGKGSVHEKHL